MWVTLEMKIILITQAEILSIIRALKPQNSTGYDEVPSKILRHCA
jgi:hypothetical protein